MKFIKISKSKTQALAKYLFRKCRTLQRNRRRDVTNFVDRLEIVIHDFIRRAARQCCVHIAAHMHSGNLVALAWRDVNGIDMKQIGIIGIASILRFSVTCYCYINFQGSGRKILLFSLLLTVSDSSGMKQTFFCNSTNFIILTCVWFNTELGTIRRDLFFLMIGKYYEF